MANSLTQKGISLAFKNFIAFEIYPPKRMLMIGYLIHIFPSSIKNPVVGERNSFRKKKLPDTDVNNDYINQTTTSSYI